MPRNWSGRNRQRQTAEIQNKQTLAGSLLAAVVLIACMEACLYLCGTAVFELYRNLSFLCYFPPVSHFFPLHHLSVFMWQIHEAPENKMFHRAEIYCSLCWCMFPPITTTLGGFVSNHIFPLTYHAANSPSYFVWAQLEGLQENCDTFKLGQAPCLQSLCGGNQLLAK